MSYRYDFFVAPLRCPRCGEVSAADSETNMQTRIRREPETASLGVGDRCEVVETREARYSYLVLSDPAGADPLRLVEQWDCRRCGYAPNWAEIVIGGGIIQSITPVEIDRALVQRAHLITVDAEGLVQEVTGRPFVELLGRKRPAGPISAGARRLAAASGLTEIDAHAMLVAEPELSDEERDFLREVHATLAADGRLSEAQIERLFLIARALPR